MPTGESFSDEKINEMLAIYEKDKAISHRTFWAAVKASGIVISKSACGLYLTAFRQGLKRPAVRSKKRGRPQGSKNKTSQATVMLMPTPSDSGHVNLDALIRRLVSALKLHGITRMTVDQNGNVSVEKVETFSV